MAVAHTRFRQLYYGMLVQLLASEPTPQLMAGLAQDIEARAEAAEALHPALGRGWWRLREALRTLDIEDARGAFTRLFLGPYRPEINPYESFYLTGRLFGTPLVAVRSFMKTVGLERERGRVVEPEDFLAFELEIMNWMVTRQLDARDADEEGRWLEHQARFLREHLLVWGPACGADLERARQPVIYDAVGALVGGFLALEQHHFGELGLITTVEPLEQARRRYQSELAWRGPTLDVEEEEPPGESDGPPAG